LDVVLHRLVIDASEVSHQVGMGPVADAGDGGGGGGGQVLVEVFALDDGFGFFRGVAFLGCPCLPGGRWEVPAAHSPQSKIGDF